MVDPPVVGYRFRPTDVETIETYVRPKNHDKDTSHIDGVFNTLNISSFDPWKLPPESIIKSEDLVWYFFGRKENKYNSGDRLVRKTKSGFWKKTGKPTEIKRKGVKIGEKWVLTFHLSKFLKTKWVMHEYHLFSPGQIMAYTVCKVMFKGEASEVSSPPTRREIFSPPLGGEIFEHNHSSTIQMNKSGGLSIGTEMETLFECFQSQEVENPPQELSGYHYLFEETKHADTMRAAVSNLSSDEWKSWLNDDDYEQRKVTFMQEDLNDYIPKQPISGVYFGYSSDDDDDSDSDHISATTGSIQISSTCEDSFGSSNDRIDQIIELQEFPSSKIEYEKVSKTPDPETGIGHHKLGQEKTKNKTEGTNGVQIGEKKVLVSQSYRNSTETKSDWFTNEYHATFLPPNQCNGAVELFTFCKVEYMEEGYKNLSSTSGSEIELTPDKVTDILGVEFEKNLERAFDNLSKDDLKTLLPEMCSLEKSRRAAEESTKKK